MELRRAFAAAVDAAKFDVIVLPQRSALVDALGIGERLRARYQWRSLTALDGRARAEDIGVWTVLATSRVPCDVPERQIRLELGESPGNLGRWMSYLRVALARVSSDRRI